MRDSMRSALPTRDDFRRLHELAVPVTLVQLGLMAMGVVDTLLVGHLSPQALAGVAVGAVYTWSVGTFGIGTLMGLDPVISQAVGAGDGPAVARAFQRGVVLALGLGLFAGAVYLPVRAVLLAFGQPLELVDVAVPYVQAQAPTMWAMFLFVTLRSTLQANRITRPTVIAIVVANVFNAVVCWALVFGRLGLPALGGFGAGLATALARLFMLGLLVLLAWRHVRPWCAWSREALSAGPLLRLALLGIPIGLQYELEYAIFATVALLMGRMGTVPAASHQIAINIASLTFMVPAGISAAGSVLVGQAVGSGDAVRARAAATAAIVAGATMMGASAILLRSAPVFLARLYSPDAAVVALAATLLPIAGVFQVFDGIQVVCIGVLRGAGDTTTPMLVNLVGYWLVGLPISLWFGLRLGWGPTGLWWGLVAGLVLVALVLLGRVRVRLWQKLERLDIERPRA